MSCLLSFAVSGLHERLQRRPLRKRSILRILGLLRSSINSMRRPRDVLILMCSAVSALVLRPRSSPLRARLPRMMATETAAVADEEWSPLDQWLSDAHDEHDNEFAPNVPSWTIESAGHMHSHFYGRGDFEHLGLSPPLCESLAECGFTQPSCAQQISFKPQAQGQDLVLAQPSGSGKTLAYLAPLLHRLAEAEAAEGRTPPGTCRALVLVPSSDLAQQVARVARSAAGDAVPLRIALATSEYPMGSQRERLTGGVELCVATLGRLHAHLRGGSFDLRGLLSLVVDEADTLCALAPTTTVTAASWSAASIP